MTEQDEWLRMERDFAAPVERVWRMWTEPALFRQWYGPRGMSVPVAEMELVVGGLRRICMEMRRPDGLVAMWFTGQFRAIAAPTRLSYSESLCDAEGRLIPPAAMGMPAGTPEVTEVTIDLRAVAGGTQMTLIHVGVPAGSAGQGGWAQAFDKLAGLLGQG